MTHIIIRKALQTYCDVAGSIPVGLLRDQRVVENLRDCKVIPRPKYLGIKECNAKCDLLAARTFENLMEASEGLYNPPNQCHIR